jgi:hypothetical protein
MPVSNQFSYVPLGTFDLREGKHWFYLTKHDENPLIVEGILLLPIQKQEMRLLPSTIRFLTPTRLSQGHG